MASMPAAYFDALYAADAPTLPTQPAEVDQQKHEATLACLPMARYRHALEVGCGTGALTVQLAQRCDRLLGIDLAQAALAQAQARVQGMRHVRLACRAFPGELPAETPSDRFDLIMLADVLYYLDEQALARAARVTRSLVAARGHVMLVNAFDVPADAPLSGNDAAELFIGALRQVAPVLLQVRTADYRIDLLRL